MCVCGVSESPRLKVIYIDTSYITSLQKSLLDIKHIFFSEFFLKHGIVCRCAAFFF